MKLMVINYVCSSALFIVLLIRYESIIAHLLLYQTE